MSSKLSATCARSCGRFARFKTPEKMNCFVLAKTHRASFEMVKEVHEKGQLPVPNFSAGGIATPADAALMMKLGAQTVFVGSGIFKSGNPQKRAKAIVESVLFHDDPKRLGEISKNLGEPMVGINVSSLPPGENRR